MNCPICGGQHLFPYTAVKDCLILKCQVCTHAVIDSRTAADYDADYFSSHYEARESRHRLRKLVMPYQRGGRLLDVGCGLGHFCYAARVLGFSVLACDFVSVNRPYITETLGLELWVPSSTAGTDAVGRFDVVTSWHSLEHSDSPAEYLKFVAGLLEDCGVFVLEVPTHDCIDAFVEGDSWRAWDPPFHRQHFTRQSLHRLLHQSGFAVLSEHTYNCEHVRNTLKDTRFGLVARPISMLFRGGAVACVCRKAQFQTAP
jgi:cyclopropane fatty-acyl-phospholipid synthase-like methyltransferase